MLPIIDPRILGGVALVIGYSAYVAEVLRAGIESVHPSQRLAARSLGLTYAQTLRLVVLPQGVRRVVPALMNDFVSMQKDVGLISILGVVDAISAANIAKAISFNYTAFVIAGPAVHPAEPPVHPAHEPPRAPGARAAAAGGGRMSAVACATEGS